MGLDVAVTAKFCGELGAVGRLGWMENLLPSLGVDERWWYRLVCSGKRTFTPLLIGSRSGFGFYLNHAPTSPPLLLCRTNRHAAIIQAGNSRETPPAVVAKRTVNWSKRQYER